jgi:hypothetical protein
MHHIKQILDAASFVAVVGTLTKLLPPIAAALSIVWISVQLYDRVKRGPK